MANGIFSKLYEMETGEQGPLSFAGRVRAVEGLEGMQPATPPPSSFNPYMGSPAGLGPVPKAEIAPGDPSRVQPYEPSLRNRIAQSLVGLGSSLQAGYAAGRGDLQSARQFGQLGQQQMNQIQAQGKNAAMMQQLSETLPNGIETPQDMRSAIEIFTRMGGMDPQSAMGFAMQAMQMTQAQREAQRPDLAITKFKRGDKEETWWVDRNTGSLVQQVSEGDPTALVSLQDPTKQSEIKAIEQARQLTGGDEIKARAIVSGRAFVEPMTGLPVYGSGADLKEARNQKKYAQGIERLNAAAERVRDEYGDTDLFGEVVEGARAKVGSATANRAVRDYERTRAEVLSSFLKSRSGAQVSDRERVFIEGLFPEVRELVKGGQITPIALSGFDQLRASAQEGFLSFFDDDQQQQAMARYRAILSGQDMAATEAVDEDPNPALEAALDRAIDAQEKALGRELREAEIDRLLAQMQAGMP